MDSEWAPPGGNMFAQSWPTHTVPCNTTNCAPNLCSFLDKKETFPHCCRVPLNRPNRYFFLTRIDFHCLKLGDQFAKFFERSHLTSVEKFNHLKKSLPRIYVVPKSLQSLTWEKPLKYPPFTSLLLECRQQKHIYQCLCLVSLLLRNDVFPSGTSKVFLLLFLWKVPLCIMQLTK